MTLIDGLDDFHHPELDAILERCDVVLGSKEDDEEAWLAVRAGGLGGSDTGSVLGINPYKSQTKLWLQKTGQIPDDDLSDKESVYWGVILEDIVAAEFAKRTGWTVINPRCTFIHRAIPILRANPDRLYVDNDGNLGVLECKTADDRLTPHWENAAIPPWYEAQDAHYCATLGITRSRVCVLIGGNDYRIADPDLSPELIESIADIETSWWARHVIAGDPPLVDGSESTRDALVRRWPTADGTMEADKAVMDLVLAYRRHSAMVKLWEEQKDVVANQLRAAIGDKAEARWGNVPVFTHRAAAGRMDWEAVATRAAAKLGVDVAELIEAGDRGPSSKRLNITRSAVGLATLDEYATEQRRQQEEAAAHAAA